ncbi:MAG: hypothetical protein ACPG77_13585, partial [Nannocystaceae bacterium]
LLASPYLPPFLELRLDPSNETPWGQVYVRGKTKNRVPAWRRERPQKLPAQGLTPEEWRALNEDPWPTLEHLDLGFDLRTLLDANSELKTLSPACFPALQSCSLCDPAITEQMLASLIKSPLADQLCHLQFIPEAVTTAQLREIESATAYAPGRFKHLELARELSNAELFRAAEVAEALGCLEQARVFLERREPLEWTEEGGVVVFWCQTLNQLGRAGEARTRLEKEYKRQLPMWARDCGPLLVANQLLTQYLILGELGQAEPFVSSYAPRVNRWTDASWHLTAALVHKRLGHLKPMKAALTRAGRAIKRSLKQPEEVSQALAHQAAMLAMRGKHKDAIASLRASLRASSHKPWWAKILWGTVVLDELKDEKPVRTLLQKYAPSVTQFERLTY